MSSNISVKPSRKQKTHSLQKQIFKKAPQSHPAHSHKPLAVPDILTHTLCQFLASMRDLERRLADARAPQLLHEKEHVLLNGWKWKMLHDPVPCCVLIYRVGLKRPVLPNWLLSYTHIFSWKIQLDIHMLHQHGLWQFIIKLLQKERKRNREALTFKRSLWYPGQEPAATLPGSNPGSGWPSTVLTCSRGIELCHKQVKCMSRHGVLDKALFMAVFATP